MASHPEPPRGVKKASVNVLVSLEPPVKCGGEAGGEGTRAVMSPARGTNGALRRNTGRKVRVGGGLPWACRWAAGRYLVEEAGDEADVRACTLT